MAKSQNAGFVCCTQKGFSYSKKEESAGRECRRSFLLKKGVKK